MIKTCTKCKKTLPLNKFDYRIDRDSYRAFCKECRKDAQNLRNLRFNPNATGKRRNFINARNFQLLYGISYNTYLKRTKPEHKLKQNLRKRINTIISQHSCRLKTEEMLGCSVSYLKHYLESLFQPGMTWDNYGEWEIDHIRPLSNFNLLDSKQLKLASNYTNLQPLWKSENRKKSDSIDFKREDI